MPIADTAELDGALRELTAGAGRWARLPIAAKRELLLELQRDVAGWPQSGSR